MLNTPEPASYCLARAVWYRSVENSARSCWTHVRFTVFCPQQPTTHQIHGQSSSCGSWYEAGQHCQKQAVGTSLSADLSRCRSSTRKQQHHPRTMPRQRRHPPPSSSQQLRAHSAHSVCTARKRKQAPWQVFPLPWKPTPSGRPHALSTIRRHIHLHAGVYGRRQATVTVSHEPGDCILDSPGSYKSQQRYE